MLCGLCKACRFSFVRSARIHSLAPLNDLVGFLPMAERMQHNLVAKDIVAQTIVAPADAPSAFAGLQSRKLFDLVPAAAIVRIFGEGGD